MFYELIYDQISKSFQISKRVILVKIRIFYELIGDQISESFQISKRVILYYKKNVLRINLGPNFKIISNK